MQKPDAFLEAEPKYEPMKPDVKDHETEQQKLQPFSDHKQDMQYQIEIDAAGGKDSKETSKRPSFLRLSKRNIIIAAIILCIVIFVAAFVPAYLKTHQNNNSTSPASILPGNNSVYTITIASGRAGCNQYLSTSTCLNGNDVLMWSNDDGSGRQHFTFRLVPGKTNVYNILPNGRAGCNDYLSTASCPYNLVDLWDGDDASGRQQWVALPVVNTTNQFNFMIQNGRNGCNEYLSTASCFNSSNVVDMYNIDDASGRQRWVLTPVT